MSQEHRCIMPFIDESPEFVHGFECGKIWEVLRMGDELTNHPVHTENSAQLQMICDYYKVECEIKVDGYIPEWSLLTTKTKDHG